MNRLSKPLIVAGVCVLIGVGLIVWRVLPRSVAPTPTITAQRVYQRLEQLGLVTNGRTMPSPGEGALFVGCTDQYAFNIPGDAQTTSAVFVCPRDVTDQIMAQPIPTETGFLAGIRTSPYTFRSAGGAVIVSVSPFAGPELAERIRAEVALIPE